MDKPYGPWVDPAAGEEIVDRPPLARYGVGVLYPAPDDSPSDAESSEAARILEQAAADAVIVPGLSSAYAEDSQPSSWEGSAGKPALAADDADFDLSGANERRPTAMGISFLLEDRPDGGLRIKVTGGRYERLSVALPGGRRTWWKRVPVTAVWHLTPAQLGNAPCLHRDLPPDAEHCSGLGHLTLLLTVNVRRHQAGSLVTVALVNRSRIDPWAIDAACLFQSEFTAVPHNTVLLAYPERVEARSHPDDASFRLLYRHQQTYAVGHGCAAAWPESGELDPPSCVRADPLPEYEAPSITPDIILPDKTPLTVSMAELTEKGQTGMAQLERVVNEYEAWIEKREAEAKPLQGEFQATAERHIEECRRALARMRDGLELVRDPHGDIGLAFRLANEAMLKQQLRSGHKLREARLIDGRLSIADPPPDEEAALAEGRGNWRAFQIAFLLAAIPSTANPAHRDRAAVDLIFYPTGGGKTEAYLALSAFTMLLRRLKNHNDDGVTVLMRYTLRLLTAQQFLRAATLICALEELNQRHPRLRGRAFAIGIWVGGDSTPNLNNEAITALEKLDTGTSDNPFLLLRCPWCSAQMGPIKASETTSAAPAWRGRAPVGRQRIRANAVVGYEEYAGRVRFRCPDPDCSFSEEDNPLPVYVTDDDVYRQRPSLVIGTVDKFAQLTWKPQARAIFGIDNAGERICSPPALVIQDELHLISGPLGSMTGIYEGVIEELCTDRRGPLPIPPKLVASTATIRRHEEQIRGLYAREKVHLFPPHGLHASDSFFAVYARNPKTNALLPGRKYIGVHAPALGSMQTTQVRVFAALLQAAKDAPPDQQDPWWTLMTFFNSLRELGNSLSLMQSDIPDYLKTINNRSDTNHVQVRFLNRVEEMTSRLSQSQVPEVMEKLAQDVATGKAIDVGLASSLIEVGIDIVRLSLMSVVGQPKSTSQYIQVTGRVGRKWEERPGLIITLYGAAKARDRSHFERFRTYHQRLYAQVEPASVTPFAPAVLDRALHAAVVAYIRQTADKSFRAYPFLPSLFKQAEQLLKARVETCDPDEAGRVAAALEKLRNEWVRWQPSDWGSPAGPPKPGDLLRAAGQYADEDIEDTSWVTPTSLRGADAECRAELTHRYAREGDSR
ncbi:helicase-related protein [Nonomuraea sp. NPDC004297]